MYIIVQALLTTKWVKLIEKKEFVAATFNSNTKTFIKYVPFVTSADLNIHLFYRVQVALIILDKAFTVIPSEYGDFAIIIFLNFEAKLPKYTRINYHCIDLLDYQQLLD